MEVLRDGRQAGFDWDGLAASAGCAAVPATHCGQSNSAAVHLPDSSGASGIALAMPLPMFTIRPLPRAFMSGSTILQSCGQRAWECKRVDGQAYSGWVANLLPEQVHG